MNEQLLEVAQTAVAQCEVEQLSEDDTLHMTIDALIRYARQGVSISNPAFCTLKA